MRHLSFLIVLMGVLVPTLAEAITLEWEGGTTQLDFSQARTCTLVVKPSSGETVLPSRWRLFWVGVSSVPKPVQLLSSAGPSEAAPVCELLAPSNSEERLSNTSTAEFCSGGGGQPTALAAYVLLLDPSLEARFTVAPEFGALPEGQFENAEVVVNGGSTLDFPAELRTYRALPDTLGQARAGVVGRGLDRVQTAVLVHSKSGLPDEPLEILSRSDRTMVVRTPATIPNDAVLVLRNGDEQAVSAASIGDPDPTTSNFGPHMVPDYPYEAKDFAFLYAQNQFHIFYNLINPLVPASQSEVEFGHAVSQNLYNWTQLAPVLHTRPGKWDDKHVWAPSIVEQNGTYYMFYTGVSTNPLVSEGTQRIGVAISTDLINWTRFDDPIFDCSSVPWSYCDYGVWEGTQFRDPFVMPNPASPSDWLMYYVTTPGIGHDQLITGVATSPGLTSGWADLQPMWITDKFPPNFMGWTESPMAFSKANYWFLFASTNSGHPILYHTTTVSPVADSTAWTTYSRLYDIPGAGVGSDVWIAPEFLRHAGKDYFAAVSRAAVSPGVEIREMIWGNLPAFSLTPPAVTAVEPVAGAASIALARTSPVGSASIEFRVDLASSGRARLEIYDVGGRKVAEVFDEWLPAGSTPFRWDGRSSRKGTRAESGLYFARLVTNHESRAIRVPYVR